MKLGNEDVEYPFVVNDMFVAKTLRVGPKYGSYFRLIPAASNTDQATARLIYFVLKGSNPAASTSTRTGDVSPLPVPCELTPSLLLLSPSLADGPHGEVPRSAGRPASESRSHQ